MTDRALFGIGWAGKAVVAVDAVPGAEAGEIGQQVRDVGGVIEPGQGIGQLIQVSATGDGDGYMIKINDTFITNLCVHTDLRNVLPYLQLFFSYPDFRSLNQNDILHLP